MLFGLFKKTSPEEKAEKKRQKWMMRELGPALLIYAYQKQGANWGDDRITYEMERRNVGKPVPAFYKDYVEFGIIRESTGQEALPYLSLVELRDVAAKMNIKPKRKKSEIIEQILASGQDINEGNLISKKVTMLSNFGNELLEKHSYIPYLAKEGKYLRLDYDAIWAYQNMNPDARASEAVKAGIDKDYLVDSYFEDEWEPGMEIEYDMTEEEYKKEVRRNAREWAADEIRDIKEQIKADIKSGALT